MFVESKTQRMLFQKYGTMIPNFPSYFQSIPFISSSFISCPPQRLTYLCTFYTLRKTLFRKRHLGSLSKVSTPMYRSPFLEYGNASACQRHVVSKQLKTRPSGGGR